MILASYQPAHMNEIETTLARWEEEGRVRAQLAAPGVARPTDVLGRSGLDILRAISGGQLPGPPRRSHRHLADGIRRGRIRLPGASLRTVPQSAGHHPRRLDFDHARLCGRMRHPHYLAGGQGLQHRRTQGEFPAPVDACDSPRPSRGTGPEHRHTRGLRRSASARADGKLYAHATTTCVLL